jgi:hypothetical protein
MLDLRPGKHIRVSRHHLDSPTQGRQPEINRIGILPVGNMCRLEESEPALVPREPATLLCRATHARWPLFSRLWRPAPGPSMLLCGRPATPASVETLSVCRSIFRTRLFHESSTLVQAPSPKPQPSPPTAPRAPSPKFSSFSSKKCKRRSLRRVKE